MKKKIFIILFTVIPGMIAIFVFVTGKNLPDFFPGESETTLSREDGRDSYNSGNLIDSQNSIESLDDTDEKEVTTHRYELFDEGTTQENAIARCQELGGHLLTVTSAEEQKYISDMIKTAKVKNIWLGANLVDDKWKWITGEEFSFQNWVDGEPNNVGGEQSAIMMYTYDGVDNDNNVIFVGGWNDESPKGRDWSGYTAQETGFICEWE